MITTALNTLVKSTDVVVSTIEMCVTVEMLSPEAEAAAEFGIVGRIVGSDRLRVVVAIDVAWIVRNVVGVAGDSAIGDPGTGTLILRVVVPPVKVKIVMVLACAMQRVIVDDP